MFCQNCGKQIEDGVNFCPGCGSQVAVASVPVAQKEANPTIDGFSTLLKLATKCDADSLMSEAAKASNLSWIIFGAASVVMFAVTYATNIYQANSWSDFGINLLFGFLWSLLTFGVAGIGAWLIAKIAGKTEKPFLAGFSIAGAASIPVTAICAVNLLLGFIDYGVVEVTFCIAAIVSLVLGYLGAQKLTEKKLPFLTFIIYIAAVILTAFIIMELIGAIISSSLYYVF